MTDPLTQWWQLLETSSQAQAALVAQTLRDVNAPIVEALDRQRELQHRIKEAAEQLAALAAQMENVTEQVRASLDPYLNYVDWLADPGSRGVSSG
jgi:ABC-type transporter Mla subunit MlaD